MAALRAGLTARFPGLLVLLLLCAAFAGSVPARAETEQYGVAPGTPVSAGKAVAPDADGAWAAELDLFGIVARDSGYMSSVRFLDFLDRARSGAPHDASGALARFGADPVGFVRESGLAMTLPVVLLGGIALNLTPCVLPMIPVTLAIIGAGAGAGSRRRGFRVGAAYGAGIAFTYGTLATLVAVTGSLMGTLQASPWFSLGSAALFVVLALCMFDVFSLDISSLRRFRSVTVPGGGLAAACAAGSLTALLAGACVAPVVAAVVVLAGGYGPVGALLPFVLGLGMAAPWPLIGAGVPLLPRPGRWMLSVKYVIGAVLLCYGLYGGYGVIRSFRPPADGAHRNGPAGMTAVDGRTNAGFAEALRRARTDGRPVFIDFRADWCKNCTAMEGTTLRNSVVVRRLAGYQCIMYDAGGIRQPRTMAVLERFGVRGLPTYVILRPVERAAGR